MSLVSGLAVYFVVWWLALFVVLPFGVKGQHEMDGMTAGTDPGAPHEPWILRKLAATTLLAAIIFSGIYLYFGIFDKSLSDLVP